MTSESIYYGTGHEVPGGGTGNGDCPSKAEPGSLPLNGFLCTLPAGHEGWHEAGVPGGLMIATWSDE